MKVERELAWGVKLLQSRFVKGFLLRKGSSGCKSDFEKEVGASENNKEFRIWLDYLISQGILEFAEVRKVGNFGKDVDTYFVNKAELEKLLSHNQLWIDIERIFDKKRVI